MFSKFIQVDDDDDFSRLVDPDEEEERDTQEDDGVPHMEVDNTPVIIEDSGLNIGGNYVDDDMVGASEAAEKKIQKRVEKDLSHLVGQILEDVRFAMQIKVCFFLLLSIFIVHLFSFLIFFLIFNLFSLNFYYM